MTADEKRLFAILRIGGLLIDGKRAPTRALILLTHNSYRFARIQCAQFKGSDRAVFLDRREYGGPLYKQVDETVQFVLRNIRLGAEIKGLYRKDEYELPLEAIREAIVEFVRTGSVVRRPT